MEHALTAYLLVGLISGVWSLRYARRSDRAYYFFFGLISWPFIALFMVAELALGSATYPESNFTPEPLDPTNHPD